MDRPRKTRGQAVLPVCPLERTRVRRRLCSLTVCCEMCIRRSQDKCIVRLHARWCSYIVSLACARAITSRYRAHWPNVDSKSSEDWRVRYVVTMTQLRFVKAEQATAPCSASRLRRLLIVNVKEAQVRCLCRFSPIPGIYMFPIKQMS